VLPAGPDRSTGYLDYFFAGDADASWVDELLEFDREVAGLIRERLWHASQSVTDRPDGGVTLALDVSHDPHLLSWIRGFGSNARVVSPAAVVKDMKEDSARMSARYATD